MTFITEPTPNRWLSFPAMNAIKKLTPIARLAWLIVGLNLFVIVWGGFVSASGSGDGCGASWPLCHQLATAETRSWETFVEFFHRITSGLALIGIFYLAWRIFRHYPPGHIVRLGAAYAVIFIITESLLGAALVIFKWVDTNESLARAIVQPIHLVNTFLLMASLGVTAWWAMGNQPPRWSRDRKLLLVLAGGLLGVVLVSGFGTIASLASTIFPSESFFEGVQKDFARNVHYLIRLRVWHPLIAAAVGGYLFYLGRWLEQWWPDERLAALHQFVLMAFIVQFGMGALNAILLTPLWLQMLHLLGAHLLWLGMILLNVTALGLVRPAEYQLALSEMGRE